MADERTTNDTLGTALGAAALGVGVLGALSPAAFRGLYGVRDDSAEATYLTRLFSTRNMVLGGLSLVTKAPAERRRVALASAVLNGVDLALGLATTRSGVSRRTRLLGPLTSGAFALGGALVAGRQG